MINFSYTKTLIAAIFLILLLVLFIYSSKKNNIDNYMTNYWGVYNSNPLTFGNYNDCIAGRKDGPDDKCTLAVSNCLYGVKDISDMYDSEGNGRGCLCQCNPPPPPPRPSTCFIKGSKIMMADYSEKPIEEIKVGDLVLSGKTLKPVSVIILMSSNVKYANLIGFNDIEPFAKENHTFISPNKKRVCANPEMALSKKHWNKDDLGKLENGTLLYKIGENKEKKVEKIENMKNKLVEEDIYLYDIITTDNTFIVNNYCVNDDFPDIKSHPIVSLRIFDILQEIKDIKIKETDKINEIIKNNKHHKVDETLFEHHMKKFILMCSKNSDLIHKANYIWINYFDELNDISSGNN